MKKRLARKARSIWLALQIISSITILVARILSLYASLRIRLWHARWRHGRRFAAVLQREGLPRSLAEELVSQYKERMRRDFRMPGLRGLLGYSYKRRGRH